MTGNQTAEQLVSRWMRAQRALKAGDRAAAGRLSPNIETCSGSPAAGSGDPLEAALFALLVGVVKELYADSES